MNSGGTFIELYYKAGLKFECTQCSACCRFDPGFVYLSENEILKLSNFLNLSREEFIQKFCRRVFAFNEMKFSLIEKKNYDCIFWDKETRGCAVYPVRPVQCSTYPFWPSILESKDAWESCGKGCPGIDRGKLHSLEEIEERKKQYEKAVYGTD